ncbi:MAG TPA: phenylacetate--CoA ligase family protein, partial [Chloroflexota bacterium]
YQVRQTLRGADVAVVAMGEYDQAAITRQLVDAYARLGLPDAEFTVRTAGTLERVPGSGKLKRFIPLPH